MLFIILIYYSLGDIKQEQKHVNWIHYDPV